MSHSTSACNEQNSASTLPEQPSVLVVRKHHFLVRWSHWLNVPILLGLILSGISVYWASPLYQHKPDPEHWKHRCGRGHRNLDMRHLPGEH
jgi:hypothetical protein